MKKEKLIERLKQSPKDFSWRELKTLLSHFGYAEIATGKTSGSRAKFKGKNTCIQIHKPHPGNILKQYQIAQIIEHLTKEGFL